MSALTTIDRPRLLMSARDPSTAIAFERVIAENARSGMFEIKILASGVAMAQLASISGVPSLDVVSVDASTGKKSETALTREIMARWQPDLCLSGVSGPDHGIDEILISEAAHHQIKSYVFQSYWGDLNPKSIPFLDSVLVVDRFAADVTASKTSAKIVIVGSPQYDTVRDIDIEDHRQVFKSAVRSEPQHPVVAVMGQPLEDYAGYFRTFEVLADAIQGIQGIQPVIAFRNHPKESLRSVEQILNVFHDRGLIVADTADLTLNNILCGADLVATPFSTTGVDLQMLNRVSDTPLATTCYMMFEPELVDVFQRLSGLDAIPNSDPTLAACLTDRATIAADVQLALSQEARNARWHAIHETFLMPGGGAARLLSTLANEGLKRQAKSS